MPHNPTVFEHLIDEITDLALLAGGRELIIHASSRSIRAHLALSDEALRGRRLGDLPPCEEERALLCQQASRVLQDASGGGRTSLRIRLGSRVHVPVPASLTRIRDEEGGPPLLMLVAPNVGTRGTHEGPIDSLTGLPLRQALDQRLADLRCTAGNDEYHALFFLDVDRFKAINDGHGHLVGDAVLQAVARRLAHSLRPGDLIVRFGGDEFVALVPTLSSPLEAEQIARRIQDAMREPFAVACEPLVSCPPSSSPRIASPPSSGRPASGPLAVSVSVGVSLSSTAELNGWQLLHTADRAMYRAKSLGPHGPFIVLAAG